MSLTVFIQKSFAFEDDRVFFGNLKAVFFQEAVIFSRVHATLQPALSVGRSVGPSVGRSVGPWKILTFFDIKVS